MDDLNKKILQAMQDNQADENLSEEQANTLQLIGRSFKGTARITISLVIFLQLIFAGLTAYCVYHLLESIDIAIKINWLTGAIGAFIAFAALRLWLFMEINRLSVIRELKRVELQLAVLSRQTQSVD